MVLSVLGQHRIKLGNRVAGKVWNLSTKQRGGLESKGAVSTKCHRYDIYKVIAPFRRTAGNRF